MAIADCKAFYVFCERKKDSDYKGMFDRPQNVFGIVANTAIDAVLRVLVDTFDRNDFPGREDYVAVALPHGTAFEDAFEEADGEAYYLTERFKRSDVNIVEVDQEAWDDFHAAWDAAQVAA